jgi:putative SOS response-associated peptidase YedK
MCNLYRLQTTRWEMASYYEAADAAADMEKDYVSPGRPGLVVTAEGGIRQLQAMRWGFPPPPNVRSAVVNVRNYSSSFWRSALKNPERRCLVPVTSFQEWAVEPDPDTGKKRPHWFTVPSRPIFTFAGVWRPTDTGPAFAFLTCGYDGDPSNHVCGAIHPKAIPVILHDQDYDRWLKAPIEEALTVACAYPSQLMAVG